MAELGTGFSGRFEARFVDDEDVMRTGRAWMEVDNGQGILTLPLAPEYKSLKDSLDGTKSAVEGMRNEAKASADKAASEHTSTVNAASAHKSFIDDWSAKWGTQVRWLVANASELNEKVKGLLAEPKRVLEAEISTSLQEMRRILSSTREVETNVTKISQSAQNAVRTEIDKLKGGAPAAFDTLGEIAERIKQGGSLESSILQQIASKAPKVDFDRLAATVGDLSISKVKGLTEALSQKANLRHTHNTSDFNQTTSHPTKGSGNSGYIVTTASDGSVSIDTPTSPVHIANKDYVDTTFNKVIKSASQHGNDYISYVRVGRYVTVTTRVSHNSALQKSAVLASKCPDWARPFTVVVGANGWGSGYVLLNRDGTWELSHNISDRVCFTISYLAESENF